MPPFVKNPLGGNLGARTASFFKLDPTGTVPVESVIDLVPALNQARVTVDIIDNENKDSNYLVTTNALQDFRSAQSNVHKDLVRITVTGTLISSVDLGLVGSVGTAGIPGFGGGLRADLIRLDNLEKLGDERKPIMFVSPRIDLPKAFIEFISRAWDPELGDNSIVTVGLVEARIVNPLIADVAVPDVASSFTGNNAKTSAGAQGASEVQAQATDPLHFGLPPSIHF